MPEGGEKTEQASPKKREDERKKGNVLKSQDVTTIVSLVVSFYAVSMYVGSFISGIKNAYIGMIGHVATANSLVIEDVMELGREAVILFATTALPPMLVVAFATVMSVGAQTRFLFSQEQIKFKLDRLNPLTGIKKLFSLRSLVELLKSLIKIVLLAWLLYLNIQGTIRLVPQIMGWSIEQAVAYTGEEIMSLIISTAIAFGGVASLDFLYQRWEFEKNIRMTKQEVKDEYKQMEGNPEIKSARRQKQRDFAQKRMMSQVKEADVVVRNPTHYAVALRYNPEKDMAPLVLAKGKGLIALKIVEEAEKHGIPALENRALARGLYDLSDIDDIIPPELYQPVAELLAWLYTTKDKGKIKQ